MEGVDKQSAEVLDGMLDLHCETLQMLFEAGVLDKPTAINKFEDARKVLEQHGLPTGRTFALREVVTRLRGWR